MSDAQRRAIRGFFQIGLVSAVIALLAAFELIQWTETQTVAVMAVATPVVSFIQNWLEDNTQTPALLKAPTSPGANPVPEPPRRMERPSG